MRRRDFMRKLLGGAAAALVGSAIPRDLDAAEMALLEERVRYRWNGHELVVTNETQEAIEVRGNVWSDGTGAQVEVTWQYIRDELEKIPKGWALAQTF